MKSLKKIVLSTIAIASLNLFGGCTSQEASITSTHLSFALAEPISNTISGLNVFNSPQKTMKVRYNPKDKMYYEDCKCKPTYSGCYLMRYNPKTQRYSIDPNWK